jgi:hypothetical protein
MPAVTLNGVVFNGTMLDAKNNSGSVRIAPQKLYPTYSKPGKVFVAPNGARTLVQRGVKKVWHLEWQQTTPLTQASIETIAQLSTTFTMVIGASSITVQCEDGDYDVEPVLTMPSGAVFYDAKLLLHEP